MLNLLDASLEEYLRTAVPLDAADVDVSFEAPDDDWGAGITKPTVNLYLWDVRRNDESRQSGLELTEDAEGRPVRRPSLPRVDCRYLVTAWTTEVGDEHALLGQVLATVLATDEVPPDVLAGPYEGVRPLPVLSLAAQDASNKSDLWSALGGQLKAGLDLIVTATVDAIVTAPAGPPVERYDLRARDATRDDAPVDQRSAVASDDGGVTLTASDA